MRSMNTGMERKLTKMVASAEKESAVSLHDVLDLPELPEELAEAISAFMGAGDDPKDVIRRQLSIKDFMHKESPNKIMPVDRVVWVPLEKVVHNDYNPNSVASVEMNLLYVSINHDGYTMPVVTIYNPERDLFEIIDGFHRYSTLRNNPDLQEKTNGLLPIVVLEKDINDRMASTVRHNRARGTHSIQGMSSMVYDMLKNGWNDADICNELGMSPDELVRLKHITGFSKLFRDVEFNKVWKTKSQMRTTKNYKEAQEYLAEQGVEFDPFDPEHHKMVRQGVDKVLEEKEKTEGE